MYGGSTNAGNMWTENTTNNAAPMAPYLNVMQQIHVLLVDNDPKALFETGKMLEMCSYKVTFVDLASSAITMLSNQDTRFDVVMASTDSPDLQGYKLLQLAVAMSFPVVLLSVDEDAFFTTTALGDGAFLIIQKPAPMEILRYLWQHIIRENINATNNNFNVKLTGRMNCTESFEMEGGIMMNNVVLAADNNNGKGKQIVTEGDGDYCDAVNHRTGKQQRFRRKSCAEWTAELHSKFIDAVEKLGGGRCFPKEILQLMNVPGLTRMQVASHLQKCRNANWRLPEERNSNQSAIRSGSNSDFSPLPIKARRFGSMPKLSMPSSRQANAGSSAQNLTKPAEPGPVQNMMGSTEPVANTVDYGQLLVPHQQQINNVDYGAGTDQYLSNLPDNFFDFNDNEVDSLIQNFASMPQDPFGGFNHVPSSDYNQDAYNNNEGNYDQWNDTYFGGANASG